MKVTEYSGFYAKNDLG